MNKELITVSLSWYLSNFDS